jgi:hypothetical protein
VELIDEVTKLHPPNAASSPYPRPLEVLSRSLLWGDEEFIQAVKQNETFLRNNGISDSTIAAVLNGGITAREPVGADASQGNSDRQYVRELAFERFQKEIELLNRNDGKALVDLLSESQP